MTIASIMVIMYNAVPFQYDMVNNIMQAQSEQKLFTVTLTIKIVNNKKLKPNLPVYHNQLLMHHWSPLLIHYPHYKDPNYKAESL